MALVEKPPVFVGTGEEVLRDRLRISVLGRLRDATLMAEFCGQPDDCTTSLLQVMVKSALVFVVDKEDRAELGHDEVVEKLGGMLKKNQRKTVNDVLLSALGEALHYVVEKWPREDSKGECRCVGASEQRDIASIDYLDEVIDHPIDAVDEEKAIPFLPAADFLQEPIEHEDEHAFPIEGYAIEEVVLGEETWESNLFQDNVQRTAKEYGSVKEESDMGMIIMKRKVGNWTQEDNGGLEDEAYEPSDDGEDGESGRKLQLGTVDASSSHKKGAQKKANSPKLLKSSVKKRTQRQDVKAKLSILDPADYKYDAEASWINGRFKCARCGKGFTGTRGLIGHVRSKCKRRDGAQRPASDHLPIKQENYEGLEDEAYEPSYEGEDGESGRKVLSGTVDASSSHKMGAEKRVNRLKLLKKINRCRQQDNVKAKLAILNPTDFKYNVEARGKGKFKCTQCGMGFTGTQGLIDHVRSKCKRRVASDGAQRPASDHLPIKEENYEGMEAEYEPSDEREDGESEREVQSGTIDASPSHKLGAEKKINSVKLLKSLVKNNRWRQQDNVKAKLAILNPTDYIYDVEASWTKGRFKCTRCGKGFTGTQGLIEHVNSHTGDRRYRCTFCSMGFAKYDLLNHHRNHTCELRPCEQKKTDYMANGREKGVGTG